MQLAEGWMVLHQAEAMVAAVSTAKLLRSCLGWC